ncbi:unnamed protein product [Miscanthus lutarioriparius]|uniref:Uncharacterized protein n=1 Tax=Miscanthus lutarioriparius TaxID=422564 RepID=A0A811S6K7_9POAL|nr:unnamed protein product [Miscanthus lutarioriparius]
MDDDAQDAIATMAAAIRATLPPPVAPSMVVALATINVKTHILFALELDPPNYSTWRELFLTHVGKFGASSHIDGMLAPAAPDAAELAVDCSIRSVIYSSSSPRVMRLIMETDASAHTVWTKAVNLFLDNKASQAMTLEAKFHALAQGDRPANISRSQRRCDEADAGAGAHIITPHAVPSLSKRWRAAGSPIIKDRWNPPYDAPGGRVLPGHAAVTPRSPAAPHRIASSAGLAVGAIGAARLQLPVRRNQPDGQGFGDVPMLNLLVPHNWIGKWDSESSLFLNSAKHMLIWKLLPMKLQLDVSPGAESIVNCYHVKHSFDKKNEYLDDAEDQLAHSDRSMFQGRKEKAGSYMVGDNSDVTTKPEEGAVDHHSDTFDRNENTGETVFDKYSTNLHEDDKRNTERSEAEEGQVNSADGNTEANNNNNEDETTGHAEEGKHDTESNSAAESKSEVNSTGDDMSQNNHAQEENTGVVSGTSHDEVVQGDESTSTSGSGNGSLPDDAKAEATDDHATGSLPNETGNIPSVHTDNSQNDASENQGDATSTTSDSSEHGTGEAVHIETGLEDESATASSGTGSGDDKGNSSDSTSAEENTETASGDDEKGTEMGTATEASYSKEENSENSSVSTEAENSQGDSSSGVNGSSEETSNKGDGATETSNNGEQVDPKIETSTSTNDEHNESQGAAGSSGSNDSNGNGPEQTGKTESQ